MNTLKRKFTSAAQSGGTRSMMRAIAAQPGYRRGHWMKVARSATGGKRLYVMIAGRWMDGSLRDM